MVATSGLRVSFASLEERQRQEERGRAGLRRLRMGEEEEGESNWWRGETELDYSLLPEGQLVPIAPPQSVRRVVVPSLAITPARWQYRLRAGGESRGARAELLLLPP